MAGMGLFSGRAEREFEQKQKEALLRADCEKSVHIILDFINSIETLQRIMDQEKYKEGVFMAEKCCSNPIIVCDNDELPAVGLKTVQDMILRAIVRLEPKFYDDGVQGIYNIAADGKCSDIVDVCRQAIAQLRAARA